MSLELDPNGSLFQVVKQIIQNVIGNLDLPDVVIGTVETTGPLSVRVSPQILLPADILILTEAVCMKKVDLTHFHHGDSGGVTEVALNDGRTVNTAAAVNPDNPPQAPYTIINRELRSGDRVVMLRVLGGQQYIVLSKVVNA